MAWKTGRILGPLLFGIMSVALRATGQESVYSADSLMTSFEKGAKVSPKGTQITLRDVVVESEDDKVTFKSSHNKRVICKLVPSKEDHNKPPVGSDVTVIGKVRGRGLLGNVTLDNCSVAPPAPVVADEHSASLPPDVQGDVSARASEETPATSSVPAHSEDITNEYAPTHIPLPPKPGPQEAKPQAVPASQPEQQGQTTRRGSIDRREVPYRLYTLLVLGGAIGYAISLKVLSGIGRAIRSSSHTTNASTEAVRKAALQALLLKSSNKK